MASLRGRGRGRGGGGGGADSPKGAWRGGPPNGNGNQNQNQNQNQTTRANIPIISGQGGTKTSIHEHMAGLGLVDDKSRKEFQTDAEISASRPVKERDLQRWAPGGSDSAVASNSNGSRRGGDAEAFGHVSTGGWDQFETHKRRFGGNSTYDENLYTTKLDRSAPDYEVQKKEAERLAKEILSQTSKNSHIAEERNQVIQDDKDEEEKNPNSYVPPAARKAPAPGGFAAAAARGATATTGPKVNGKPAPTGSPAPAPAPAQSQPPAAVPIATSASNNPALPATADNGLAPPAPAGPARSTSDGLAAEPKKTSPLPEKLGLPAAAATAMAKTESKNAPDVVAEYRRFAEDEMHAVKKSARDRQLADLKKFAGTFKVALPVPKDMLPILSKDAEKQKEIEARAAQQVLESKAKAAMSPKVNKTASKAPITPSKVPMMKIQAIPPFSGSKPKPPAVPIPDSANKDIQLATSPPPTDAAKKLNPAVKPFEFKPSANAFTPGKPAPSLATSSTAGAGPSNPASTAYSNPFFSQPPRTTTVNVRDDFIPWKHGAVPPANSVLPQWPYSGGARYPPNGPMGASPESFTGPPMMSPILGGPQPPMGQAPMGYMRYPGMPPPNMSGGPVFSPNHHFTQLPGGPPMHMNGPPNGMPPMFYQNGMPPPFMFSPNARPPHGPIPHGNPGPGPGPGPGMNSGPHHMNHNPNIHHQQGPPPQFYNPNMTTPQHTPHLQSNMQFPPPPQYQMSGPPGQGPGGGGGTPHGHGNGNGVFEGQGQGQGNGNGPSPGPGPGPGQGQGQGR